MADRAMFHGNNIKSMEQGRVQYVVAAKIKSLSKAKREEGLSQEYKTFVVTHEFQ